MSDPNQLDDTLLSASNDAEDMATIRVPKPASSAMPDDLQTLIVAKPAASPMRANPAAPVPFIFGRRIAKGGMGAILEANDCKLGRTIAVKVMLSEAGCSEEQKQRFIQEAAVLARLAHPNIVPVYDLGLDAEGELFYTMKLVKGRTLQHILDELRREHPEDLREFTLDRLLTIFRKVCDALAFAHAQSIIHRDLKPENIMVGEFGEVLVMDWGIAKLLGSSNDATQSRSETRMTNVEVDPAHSSLTATMDGAVMGTPNYMSPEQAMGKVNELDARSDIFSLGGILYAILTLRPPVEGKDVHEVLAKVSTADITAPTTFGTTTGRNQSEVNRIVAARLIKPLPHLSGGRVPAALSAVAMKALSLDKSQRYQSVASFSGDIDSYQSGYATTAEQAGAWTQALLFIRRHRAAAVGSALVLLVGSTLGAKALFEGRRAEQTLTELRGTAPTFEAQSRAQLMEGKLDEALAKIGYAVKLAPENADYRLTRANLLQSIQQLAEAATEYHQVLALRPSDNAAKTNLTLCESLIAGKQGEEKLPLVLQNQLLDALLAQNRILEAAPLSFRLNRSAQTVRNVILERLASYTRQGNWNNSRLKQNGEIFELNLSGLEVADLNNLKGLPISKLDIGGTLVSDLSPLVGMPLAELYANATTIADIGPLRGMKLARLHLTRTKVADISPLAGMPLESLILEELKELKNFSPLAGTPLKSLSLGRIPNLTDLSPLEGLSLEFFNIESTGVSDIGLLKFMPLKQLALSGSRVRDFSPLVGHQSLESVGLSFDVKTVDFLYTLPRLREVGIQPFDAMLPVRFTANDFFARFGPQHPELRRVWEVLREMGLKDVPVRCVEMHPVEGLLLHLHALGIENLAHLNKLPATYLGLGGNRTLRDLSPLRGMSIKRLNVAATMCTDISPLMQCSDLEELTITNIPSISNIEMLRKHPRLLRISARSANGHPAQTSEEFWKEYDAQQAAGKK